MEVKNALNCSNKISDNVNLYLTIRDCLFKSIIDLVIAFVAINYCKYRPVTETQKLLLKSLTIQNEIVFILCCKKRTKCTVFTGS